MAQTERKEQVTNDLVKGITSAYEGLKKGPSRGTVIFLAVVVAAVLIGLLVWYLRNLEHTADSARWLQLDGVVFPEQVETLREDKDFKKDTTQDRVLRFTEARMKLAQGVRDLGSADTDTRKKARKSILEAKDVYEDLAKKASSLSPQLHQEAIWGAAKANEALGSPDDVEEAKKLYQKLKSEYPKSALGKDAVKQLERLNDPKTKDDLRDIARELGDK